MDAEIARPRRRWPVRLLIAYVLVLVVSHLVAAARSDKRPLLPGQQVAHLRAVDGGELTAQSVRVVYRRFPPGGRPDAPAVVLLHGSPGSIQDFGAMGARLGERYDVFVPDLPGFMHSERHVPDYSTDAHSLYVQQLLDELGRESAHLVAFSMAGGAAVRAADRAPDRIRSVSMISAIGVQELELFGSYRMNHVVHGMQLAMIRAIDWGFPHFGAFDDAAFGVPYARNFFDTDQRPLRAMLERHAGPMLIVHGREDALVPPEVAIEHHRIVAQSELQWLPEGHLVLFSRTDEVADVVGGFLDRVELGRVSGRAGAAPERVAAAATPFAIDDVAPLSGLALLVLMGLLIASAFVSEDLTCIGAGLLVAQGRMDFVAAILACWLGNFLSDLALYVAGRWLGRPVLSRAPLRWFIPRDRVDAAAAWFGARSARAIFVSRFVPGLRLPTYVAAGVLRTNLAVCTLYFALACAIWTPIIVGFSALVGTRAYDSLEQLGRWGLPAALILIAAIFFVERVGLKLLSHRGRRLLVGSFGRVRHFEFWPRWVFYAPVTAYVVWLALRHRSLSLVTAVNPAIRGGGLVGESKSEILEALRASGAPVPALRTVGANLGAAERVAAANAFLRDHELSYPVVLKPDVGERGEGVSIVRDDAQLGTYLAAATRDTIVQEYADGHEFGVFYYRIPGEERGCVFSIAEKRLPTLTGDGVRTLERLILDDARAVRMAPVYLRTNASRLRTVPAVGAEAPIAEIGTHSLGAVFLDGEAFRTPALEDAFDRISRAFGGFYFGRYDVRATDLDVFRRGEGFRILELNGLTSEAAHIYDPRHGLVEAYRVLFEQWRIAFRIAAENRRRGAQPLTLREAVREILDHLRR